MQLSEGPAGLSQRIDGLVIRVDRFEARVDERFEAIDRRFDAVEARLDELRRHFDLVAEASRDDFRKLYDLFHGHVQRMEAGVNELAVTLRAEMKLGYAALDSRITIPERNARPRRKRTRH